MSKSQPAGRGRKPLPSTKNHKFESFNQKIARLKIEPVRRSRQQAASRLDADDETPHVRRALSYWNDSNLSARYVDFASQAARLCESLPQILHHEEQLVRLLVEAIQKGDKVSLEPLLSLVGHLAHDLGIRFERHYSRVLQTVLALTTVHQDVEVIEWSFSCIAWLFRYLSKLLVVDLRPTFNLLSSALGKSASKPHVARFTAEAMSYLLRKAASHHSKDPAPLPDFVKHVFTDLSSSETDATTENIPYRRGLQTLFAEAMKGVEGTFQSSAETLLSVLLNVEQEVGGVKISSGVITALLHHGNSSTCRGLVTTILEHSKRQCAAATAFEALEYPARLLHTVATVRHGTRIEDWHAFLSANADLFTAAQALAQTPRPEAFELQLVKTIAAAYVYAPVEILLQAPSAIMDYLPVEGKASNYLLLCIVVHEMRSPDFPRLCAQRLALLLNGIGRHDVDVLANLPQLIQAERDNAHNDSRHLLQASVYPKSWQLELQSLQKKPLSTAAKADLVLWTALFGLVHDFKLPRATESAVASAIESWLKKFDLQTPETTAFDVQTSFLFGSAGQTLLRIKPPASQQMAASLLKAIHDIPLLALTPTFLRTLSCLIDAGGKISFTDLSEPFIDSLLKNLTSPSPELRSALMICLESLLKPHRPSQDLEVLRIAQKLEGLTLNFQSSRAATMLVRQLGNQYRLHSHDPILGRAIPLYCFGLLTMQFTPLWNEVTEVFKTISSLKAAEETIMSVAFDWLDSPSPTQSSAQPSVSQSSTYRLTEFECSNTLQFDTILERKSEQIKHSQDLLNRRFDDQHQLISSAFINARAQGLRVLAALPILAERKSRLLVPIFLQWTSQNDELADASEPETLDSVTEPRSPLEGSPSAWSYRDGRQMLEIISNFNNVKAAFRSDEVLDAMLRLLASPDSATQSAALKFIFRWKMPHIYRYQQNLENLMDDARFRDELTALLAIGQDDDALQPDHVDAVMPVLLRLLYGRAITRKGAGHSSMHPSAKRKAILDALLRASPGHVGEFIGIAVHPIREAVLCQDIAAFKAVLDKPLASARVQLGIIVFLKDMLDALGQRATPFAGLLIKAALFCTINATRQSDGESALVSSTAAKFRAVRQSGLQALVLFMATLPAADVQPLLPIVISELISPKVDLLSKESTQAVSSLLRLIAACFASPSFSLPTLQQDPRVFKGVADCLGPSSIKTEVKTFILGEILKPFVLQTQHRPPSPPIEVDPALSVILQQEMLHLLAGLRDLVVHTSERGLLDVALDLLSDLSRCAFSHDHIFDILDLSSLLLQRSPREVSPKAKGAILETINQYLSDAELSSADPLWKSLWESIAPLFDYFLDRQNRSSLTTTLSLLANSDDGAQTAARICADVNAFSATVVDEADFDRRLRGFRSISNEESDMTLHQWKPIVYSCMYYTRDEDAAIRSSAAFALQHFLEISSRFASDDSRPHVFIAHVILPAIRHGISNSDELVRAQYLNAMAALIRAYPSWTEVSDMTDLLVGNDEEASFFTNMLHIQQHRRLRALRRLGTAAASGSLSSINLAHFFVPLLEHFVLNAVGEGANPILSTESIRTVGELVSGLEWPQFRALFRRYMSWLTTKPSLEKIVVRMLEALASSLQRVRATSQSRPQFARSVSKAEESVDNVTLKTLEAGKLDIVPPCKLVCTMPGSEKLAEDILGTLLPPLRGYMRQKEDTALVSRSPVGFVIAQLLQWLPEQLMTQQLGPLLTDLSQALRSKSQDSRDATRRVLAAVAELLGPRYFAFIVRELRAALLRGYQLHVLSYTLHSLLVSTIPIAEDGDLDGCYEDIVNIIVDDIFGKTGQEKEAEGFVSSMKEAKSSKSYDSAELLAKVTPIQQARFLLRPVQSALHERLDSKKARKVDELLRRIGLGFGQNAGFASQDTLIFCYEVIQQNLRLPSKSTQHKEDGRTQRFEVRKGIKAGALTSSAAPPTWRLTKFALDLMRTVLHKHPRICTAENLQGLASTLGDCLLSGQDEVVAATLRLLADIAKSAASVITPTLPVYLLEATKLIKNAVSTNTEVSQAALKFISTILREHPTAEIKDRDIAYILQRVRHDLEDPSRQGVTFALVKNVLLRRLVLPEVYELMDSVAIMMVTYHDAGARTAARSLYFEFLMNYPQARDRLSKQLAFLTKNLEYKHTEGRQSVMEALHLLFRKIGPDHLQDVGSSFHLPLVMVFINDESTDCRRMAGALIQTLFDRADDERARSMLSLYRAWLAQSEQPLMRRTAIQLFGLLIEKRSDKVLSDVPALRDAITEILALQHESDNSQHWESIYVALGALLKMCQQCPEQVFDSRQQSLWVQVQECIAFRHRWIKSAASQLLGLLLANLAQTNAGRPLKQPLSGSGGIVLDPEAILRIARYSMRALKTPDITDELGEQLVKNVAFVVRVASNETTYRSSFEPSSNSNHEALQDSDDDDDEALPNAEQQESPDVLKQVIWKAALILRQEPSSREASALAPKTLAMQLLAALCKHVSSDDLALHVEVILMPLLQLTDPSVPAPFSADAKSKEVQAALMVSAQEILDTMQTTLGTPRYVEALAAVQARMRSRREDRRAKRRVEAVTAPEKAHRDKRKKNDRKKVQRREKSGAYRAHKRSW